MVKVSSKSPGNECKSMQCPLKSWKPVCVCVCERDSDGQRSMITQTD